MRPIATLLSAAIVVAALSACESNVNPPATIGARLASGRGQTAGRADGFHIIYEFKGGPTDGSVPDGIVVGPDGSLLGATQAGGHIHPRDCKSSGCGTIFQLSGSTEKPIHLFQPQPSGYDPVGNLIDHNGVYYGAASGGKYGLGVVFSLTQNTGGKWVEATLHDFTGYPNDGAEAAGVVYVDTDGTIYGTTRAGGSGTACLYTRTGCGTFFELKPPARQGGAWSETVLHSFKGDPDGAIPSAYVVRKNGAFYGTTDVGGKPGQCPDNTGCGTIYRLTPSGSGATENVAYSFHASSSSNDGVAPVTLIDGGDGRFYGTTALGGGNQTCSAEPHVYGCGTFYSLTVGSSSKLAERVLYAFAGGRDGSEPESLAGSAAKGFYGASTYGGSGGCIRETGCGTIFGFVRSGSSWHQSLLHLFQNLDGRHPFGPIVLTGSSVIGTAQLGGTNPCTCGLVYELDI